jgi:alpha-glucoside transport system permease protein
MKEMHAETRRADTPLQWLLTALGRLSVSILIPGITFLVLWRVFIFLRDGQAPQWVTAIVAIIWGGRAQALFFVANMVVEQFSTTGETPAPFIFVGRG